jgi:DNA-binding LytR/AlgR family response regulator
MDKFNCLIVEDEPLAAEVLQDYINQLPFLECRAVCRDALFAIQVLQQEKIDVMFLDIQLPKIKGLDFIRTLRNPPQVIITTACREYALDGYELNVLDYLLKPIQFSRFLAAVNKIRIQNGSTVFNTPNVDMVADKSHLHINVNKKTVRVCFDDILYIESQKEYIRIVTKDKSLLTKCPLGEIEQQLNKDKFIRIHRSFIVAADKIIAFGAAEVELNGKQIPIGRSYKEPVLAKLYKG